MLQTGTAQPRVGHDGGEHVGRKFNFWNDFHAAHCGISHDFADVVLRVIAADALLVGASPSADFRKARIFLDFEAPTAVVDEVKLEFVELVHGHHVDELQHKRLVVIIAGRIEHHATPRAVGGVFHLHCRCRPCHVLLQRLLIDTGREVLQERLYAIENAGSIVADNLHAFARYFQAIAFLLRHGKGVDGELDGAFATNIHFEVETSRRQEGFLQITRLCFHAAVATDGCLGRQREYFSAEGAGGNGTRHNGIGHVGCLRRQKTGRQGGKRQRDDKLFHDKR